MPNNKMILSAALISATALAATASYRGSLHALKQRFPDTDPKVVTKLHREMFKEALTGKLETDGTDEAYDFIFTEKLRNLSNK